MTARRTFPLLLTVLLLSGCMSTRPDAVSTPQHTTETVTFTAPQPRLDAIDGATATLVTHHFTITLANDRLGLLQTDYVPLSTLPLAHSGAHAQNLDTMLMRVAVSTTETAAGTAVQLSATFQRLGSSGSANDDLLRLVALDSIADAMAQRMGATYTPQVSPAHYAEAVRPTSDASSPSRLRSSGRALGIIGAVVFSATLIAGAFGPSTTR